MFAAISGYKPLEAVQIETEKQYKQKSDNPALLQYVQSLERRVENLENRKLRSSGKQNIAQNRQLNGEAEIIDVIADIMAGDFEGNITDSPTLCIKSRVFFCAYFFT